MADTPIPAGTPDLREGVPLGDLAPGIPLLGRVGDEPVLLVRDDSGDVVALGARCTHYGGPLWEGLAVDGTVRCPWHHACFSLRSGERLAPPALDPLPRWAVAVDDGVVRVTEPTAPYTRPKSALPRSPASVVIVGAGAAGLMAARTLREEGYEGDVTLVDPDPDAPYDRPNLSKDFLAGTAPEAWLPLSSEEDLAHRGIRRRFEPVVRIDPDRPFVDLEGGDRLEYGALLLATGSRAARLPVPGAELPHVLTLRSLADCRRLLEAVEGARDVVVVGAGFIGMEAAAALRERELGVTVVAPDAVPFERALGPELGRRVQRVQEDHGVRLSLGRTLSAIETGRVVLDDRSPLRADVVLVAVGARPETDLAERRGIRVDDGIVVDGGMATSVDGIWAAGDIARFPHPRTGGLIRVEHWAVALRQGEVAARGMLGRSDRYDAPPFFWTRLYDVSMTYSGHAEPWDEIGVDGDLERGEALIRYLRAGETMAVAAVGRELESLEAEVELERRWGHSPAGREGAR